MSRHHRYAREQPLRAGGGSHDRCERGLGGVPGHRGDLSGLHGPGAGACDADGAGPSGYRRARMHDRGGSHLHGRAHHPPRLHGGLRPRWEDHRAGGRSARDLGGHGRRREGRLRGAERVPLRSVGEHPLRGAGGGRPLGAADVRGRPRRAGGLAGGLPEGRARSEVHVLAALRLHEGVRLHEVVRSRQPLGRSRPPLPH
mmetsp:Transcript_52882/g.155791  ORF Transcript_52882/g.155791 Transcript_52882/m.155791 type:complete len:200 (-) Transcript_52882:902-1501(-)